MCMLKRLISMWLCSIAVFEAMAQNTTYEYWIDTDYQKRVISNGEADELRFAIDLNTIPQGLHYINLRAKPADGEWGPMYRQIFLIPETDPAEELRAIEYWIDTDSAYSSKINTSDDNASLVIDISSLSEGEHQFNCRLQNGSGMWGETFSYKFEVESSSGINVIGIDDENRVLRVYMPNGMLIKKGSKQDVMNDLPKGLYIVNGQKKVKQ